MQEKKVEVAIIGAGSAGLYALGKVRPSGKGFVLINGGELGTTCARVGCMPSKAMVQVAKDYHRRHILGRYGVEGHKSLALDSEEALEHVRDLRDTFVDRVISNSTDLMSDDQFIQGYARFIDPYTLDVEGRRIHAKKIIIATGSRPSIPNAWRQFGNRIVTTDEVFEMEHLPASLAVIGLGAIGLEIGQAMAYLGVDITGFDMLQTIGGLDDPVIAQTAIELIHKDFPILLGTAADITADGQRLRVAAGEEKIVVVDKVLASLGRKPNLDQMDIEKAGLELNSQGSLEYNPQTMLIDNSSHIFIAGDVNADRPLLHEAGDEGRIAGHNAVSDEITPFMRKPPMAITFCEPNICYLGARWSELDHDKTAVGEIRFAPVGRALIMGKNKGILRVYGDKEDGKLLGAEMICTKGENLAHLLVWCLQQRLTVGQMLQMPFYHPVIEEALQAALYDLYSKVKVKNMSAITELAQLGPQKQ